MVRILHSHTGLQKHVLVATRGSIIKYEFRLGPDGRCNDYVFSSKYG